MSAPTPAPGDSSPTSGYYPDPSIPGYIRYWNGAAWVPGTSRPAPAEGEPMPTPPGGVEPAPGVVPEQQVAPAEETGPMFLDEGTAPGLGGAPGVGADRPEQPEPASAWGADASRQTGFGDGQSRVSWGGRPEVEAPQQQPALPAAQPATQPTAEEQQQPTPPARTDGTVTIRALKPGRAPQGEPRQPAAEPGQGGQQPPADGTMMVRAVRPGQNSPGQNSPGHGQNNPGAPGVPGAPGAQGAGNPPRQQPEPGTMAIRALPGQQNPVQPTPPAGAPPTGAPPAGAPSGYGYPQSGSPQQGAPAQGSGYGYPQPQSGAPAGAGAGGGAASWPQQVQHLAQGPEADGGPVTPFRPVADDPFLAAAQAQAAARPAALGKRLAARLIDTVVVGAVTGAVGVPLLSSAFEHIDGKIEEAKLSGMERTVWLLDGTTSVYFGIVLAVLLVFGALYEALPTSKWGFTLGKKLLKIEVRDIEEHAAPTFSAALKRWLVYSVPGILVIGVLGVLWCTWDRPWRQCWHDKVARTFVAG
ncbi:RDD family protein [Streptomyces sp. B-S-A8]|uniref:RDD family protein n=1 Tax=Streptomyces solicavernae TaxID=3043614 RepID=A0ABT6RZQ5_9ACTN|nr:RDD family protein [Streptomyces sp. B-S-A8]MDI3389926.1 RDD family protein [Streptomyces sp. B-S-A8]